MKVKLPIAPAYQGDLFLYNQELFLNSAYQSFLHRHDEIEVNLVQRGQGIYLVDNRKMLMRPNTLLWLFPEQEHILLDKSIDFEMWVLVLKPGYLRQICTDAAQGRLLEGRPEGGYLRELNAAQLQKVSGLCREATKARANPAFYNHSLGYILLLAWELFQGAGGAGPEGRLSPAVEKATRLIMAGRGMNDLASLAREVGLSSSNLSRLFKRETGISLTAFRNRCRVEQFLDLYGEGQERTLMDAALEAGFGSYAQFYRVFRKTMGGNPADYRRNLR